jgi:hypothetical protein
LCSNQILTSAGLLTYALFAWVVIAAGAEELGSYIGWRACSGCHQNVVAEWQKSRHAKAFESLKKSGQENLPACVSCHVTGYGESGGFLDTELTPWMVGVQCEACHGPGKNHLGLSLKKAIAPRPDVNVCRRCHTEGQNPGFDYAKMVKNIHSFELVSTLYVKGNLKATPDLFDFGMVAEGPPAVTTIILENTGDTNVVITNVRTN